MRSKLPLQLKQRTSHNKLIYKASFCPADLLTNSIDRRLSEQRYTYSIKKLMPNQFTATLFLNYQKPVQRKKQSPLKYDKYSNQHEKKKLQFFKTRNT